MMAVSEKIEKLLALAPCTLEMPDHSELVAAPSRGQKYFNITLVLQVE